MEVAAKGHVRSISLLQPESVIIAATQAMVTARHGPNADDPSGLGIRELVRPLASHLNKRPVAPPPRRNGLSDVGTGVLTLTYDRTERTASPSQAGPTRRRAGPTLTWVGGPSGGLP